MPNDQHDDFFDDLPTKPHLTLIRLSDRRRRPVRWRRWLLVAALVAAAATIGYLAHGGRRRCASVQSSPSPTTKTR